MSMIQQLLIVAGALIALPFVAEYFVMYGRILWR